MRKAVFWIVFTLVAIQLQGLIPGVDFLAAGFILALQEERAVVAVLLGAGWLLIQEGVGSLPFGLCLPLSIGLALFYAVGRQFIEPRNFLFVAILGLAYGAMGISLSMVLARLSDTLVEADPLTLRGVWQAVIMPLQWMVASGLYPRKVRRRESRV